MSEPSQDAKEVLRDKEEMERLYWDEGLSYREIAQDALDGEVTPGPVGYWMDKHGIETRDRRGVRDVPDVLKDPDELERLYWDEGLTQEEISNDVLDGEVTSGTVSYRMDKHGIETRGPGANGYSDEELLDWIHAFVQEFGVVPSAEDVRDWPGPTLRTYTNHFGSVVKAVQAAGYEPRNEQE